MNNQVEFMGKREPRNYRHKMVDVLPLATPYVVNIDPCRRCNLNCYFCAMTKDNAENVDPGFRERLDAIRYSIMPMDLFNKIVDDLCEFNPKIPVIYLTGCGEPLLNPKIADMVALLKQKKVCREIRIISNGTPLNPKLNSALIDAGLDVLKISVNALDAKGYEMMCKYKLDFQKFLDNIGDYYQKSRGTECTIVAKIFTETLKNKDEFKKFYSIFEPITDYQEVRNVEGNFWPGFTAENSGQEHVVVDETEVNYNGVCSKAFVEFRIDPDGQFCMCRQDYPGQLSIGYVQDRHIKEMWDSKERKDFLIKCLQQGRKSASICSQCDFGGLADKISDDDAKVILARMKKNN